ncbi:MAG TPA: hypothetical protein VFD06_14885 [Candidatus Polarisedimenticolia bacterium]|nr:hypothetical protein [Candidatus Polarisedimenticolia bacterium]
MLDPATGGGTGRHPRGIPGTADDGTITENFDTERDGSPGISLAPLPRGTPGVLNDTIGVWVGTAAGPNAFLVTDVHNGVESSLGTDRSGVPRPNANPCP